MKKKNLLKRGLAFLLTTVMATGLISYVPNGMTNVQAADGDATTKTIAGLGTSIIANPTEPTKTTDEWKGSYVYFGTYNGSPVKYRVLDNNTTVFGGTTMLLDCDSVLWLSVFDKSSNDWATSYIRTYLNGTFLTDNFSASEKDAIAESTKSAADGTDGDGSPLLRYVPLSQDRIFCLDAKEATNKSYGYSNYEPSATYVTNKVKTNADDIATYWWLRSAYTPHNNFAGCVKPSGSITNYSVPGTITGASPALNVKLSSVLFSSVISGTAGETKAEYKLTLLDSDMTIAENGAVTRSGDTVTIPYTITGANSANATQVSVLILDKEYTAGNTNGASVLAYGALDVDSFATAGTGTFEIPSGLAGKVLGTDYHVYILAEHTTDTNATDYASEPVEIADIYDEVSNVTVEITAPASESPFATSATVSSDIEKAVITWMNGNSEVTGNAGYNTAYTVKVTLTAKTGFIFTDNTDVTVNGNAVTATKNNDGTVTASYTFPATAKGIITYTATGYEGTYDGKAHSITVNVTDPSGATVTYSTDTGDNKTYSATNPTFTDAGEYTVYYKIEKENYTVVTGSKVVKINKQEATDNPKSPNTGDNSHIYLWLILLIGSGVAIFISCKKRKQVSNE